MGLGTGINKETFLLYLCGYLVILSMVVVLMQTEMHITNANGIIVPPTEQTTDIGLFLGMFTGMLDFPADTSFLPYLITIPFIWLPKFGIIVILGSYVKDML